mgnify:CR=1 FL=1
MRVLNKTERQTKEHLIKNNIINAWKTSLKYSTIIINNIDKKDIYDIVESIYYEYLQSLNAHNNSKNEKFINIWETVVNTINNDKNNDNVKRASIMNLHHTSVKNNNM